MLSKRFVVALLVGVTQWGCSWFSGEDPQPLTGETGQQDIFEDPPPEEKAIDSGTEPDPSSLGSKVRSVATEAENPVAEEDVNLLSKDYLRNPGVMYVSAFSLMVRKGPGSHYPSHRRLRKGMAVRVLERQGTWIKIGSGEWVSGNYLTERP